MNSVGNGKRSYLTRNPYCVELTRQDQACNQGCKPGNYLSRSLKKCFVVRYNNKLQSFSQFQLVVVMGMTKATLPPHSDFTATFASL